MKRPYLLVAAGLAVVVDSSALATDAKSIWKESIQRCTKNDLVKHGIVFMGLSSNFGPGTIFKDVASGVQIYLPASSYISSKADAQVITRGEEADCRAVSNKTFKIGANADLTKLVPISLNVDYHNIKGVTLEPTTVRWDELVLGEYETLVASAPPNVKQALLVRRQPVVTRAVHVSGLKTKVTFDNGIKIDVKKLPIPAGVTVEWGANGTLEISSKSPFYIAGVMSRFDAGALQGGSKPKLRPVVTDKLLISKSKK